MPRRLLFLTGSLSRDAGGLFESVRRLAQSLPADRYDVHVMGLWDEHYEADQAAWAPLVPRVFRVRGPRTFGFAPGLAEAVDALAADVVHLNGIWMYPSVVTWRSSSRKTSRVVISPRGMLDPWALSHAGLKKRVAGRLYERQNLETAACIHALVPEEAEAVRRYGVRTPVATVPNGTDLPELPARDPAQSTSNGRQLLYLGRFHEKKGLVPLLQAWQRIRMMEPGLADAWQLVLGGWGAAEYQERLVAETRALGITNSVRIAGPLLGAAKRQALLDGSGFVLPSLSEGLPMAVLEAWAHGLPVIMTPACHLSTGYDQQAAIRVEPNAVSIAEGIRTLMRMSTADRCDMGLRGRTLVEKQYTWSSVAARMTSVYDWLLGDGGRPEWVSVGGSATHG